MNFPFLSLAIKAKVVRDGMRIPLAKTNYFSQLISAVAILKGYIEFVIYKC